MYFINPHITAYYFNRRKQTEPVDGKFTYCYPNGNKIEKYKVSPKVYKALKKRDKKEYYSDRRQFRRRTNFPTYYNDYEDIEDDDRQRIIGKSRDKQRFNRGRNQTVSSTC